MERITEINVGRQLEVDLCDFVSTEDLEVGFLLLVAGDGLLALDIYGGIFGSGFKFDDIVFTFRRLL